MTVFWEQFLFSSRTRFNLLLQFYHRLLAHLPVLLLLSQLLPQFLMTNLRWLAMVKKLFNLVVVVVTFVMRLKPLLLLTDSLSKGSALLNNRFVLSTFSSTLSPFLLSRLFDFGLRWCRQMRPIVEHPRNPWRQCQFTSNLNGNAAR